MTFRSPYLQTYPSHRQQRLLSTRKLRVLGALILAIALPILLVALRIPPLDGWGYPLYWCHDHLWLPLVGYGYTKYFPWSLIWVVTFILASASLLYAYVSRQSLLWPLHVNLLVRSVQNAKLRGSLLAMAKRASARGFAPRQLAAVAKYVRVTCEQALWTAPTEAKAKKLAEQTLFELDVLSLTGATALERAAVCHSGFTLLSRFLAKPDRALLTTLGTRLAGTVPELVGQPAGTGTPVLLEHAREGFHMDAFALDLLYLSLLADPTLTRMIPDGPRPDLPPQALAQRVAARLAMSMSERRRLLDQLRLSLEERFLRYRTGGMPRLGLDQLPAETLATWGALTLGLALDRAYLDKHPDPLLILFDSIEGLRLSLALVPAEARVPSHLALEHLLGDLPHRHHYLAASELTTGYQSNIRAQWQHTGLERLGWVTAADFAMGDRLAWSMALAAGPDLQAEETP